MDNTNTQIITLPDQLSVEALIDRTTLPKDIALQVINAYELEIRSRCFALNDQNVRYLDTQRVSRLVLEWSPSSNVEPADPLRSTLIDPVDGANQLDELVEKWFLAWEQGSTPEFHSQLDEFRQERLAACWTEEVRRRACERSPAEWVRRAKEECASTRDYLAERREEEEPSKEFRNSFERW